MGGARPTAPGDRPATAADDERHQSTVAVPHTAVVRRELGATTAGRHDDRWVVV